MVKNQPIGNPEAYNVIEASVEAFTCCFIDALAKAGVKHNISVEQARKISTQLLLGSSKLIALTNEHPWELVDKVCSPAGTTIEGVASLQNDAFDSKVTKAYDAAL